MDKEQLIKSYKKQCVISDVLDVLQIIFVIPFLIFAIRIVKNNAFTLYVIGIYFILIILQTVKIVEEKKKQKFIMMSLLNEFEDKQEV